ncbi:MAG: hypothetical protein ABI193_24415 [Minicystis sp.]
MDMPRLAPLLAFGLSVGLLVRPAHAEDPVPPASLAPPAPAMIWQPPPLNAQPWAQHPYAPIAPSYTRRALPGTDRHSTAAMVTGIVFVGVGVLGLGVGTAVALAGKRSCGFDTGGDGPPSPEGGPRDAPLTRECPPSAGNAVGMTLLVTSTLFAGIGIPLWIFGSQRVSRYPDTARSFTRPTLLVGPGSAGLRLSF